MALYFLPASIKARLLRFALSRIDFLDEDALDLDQLDFALGKRSTINFRDVDLKVQKLTSLLPPHIEVTKASINNLRVTVPADLYASGIVVEVVGVTVKAKTVQGFDGDKRSKTNVGGTPGHDPIPTTQDLAESFLQEEPVEEKRELEAAIGTQSQHLRGSAAASSVFSDDGYDDPELGTGVGLTLPGIVTNFFNGIRDRLQVSIEGIEFHVDTEIPPEGWEDDESIPAGLVFHIGRVDVEGLTSAGIKVQQPPLEVEAKEGKRRITLESLCAGVLLDEKSMAKSRITTSSIHASPTRSRTARSDSAGRSPFEPSSPVVTRPPTVKSSSESVNAEFPPPQSPDSPRSSSNLSGMSASNMTTDADRFADADEDDNYHSAPGMSSSGTSEQFGQQSMYGDESYLRYAVDNGFFESNIEDSESPRESLNQSLNQSQHQSPYQSRISVESPHDDKSVDGHHPRVMFSSNSLPGRLQDLRSSAQAQAPPASISMSEPIAGQSCSEPALIAPAVSADDQSPSRAADPSSDGSSSASPSPASSVNNDLAQSRIFSHEEAESMYMSAMSEAPSHSSGHFHMPGAWDTSSTSSGDSDRANNLPPAQVAPTPLDPISEKDDGCETPRPGSRITTEPSFSKTSERRQSTTGPGDVGNDSPAELNPKVFTSLMDIDCVSLWIPNPDASKDTPDPDPSDHVPEQGRASRIAFAEDSIFQDVPGSFSQYAAATARPRASSTILRDSRRIAEEQPSAQHPGSRPTSAGKKPDSDIEIAVGTVRLQVDVEMIYLAMRLVKTLQELFGAPTLSEPSKPREDSGSKSPEFAAKFAMDNLQISLLKELTPQNVNINKPVGALRHAEWDPSEILLQIQLRDLKATATGRSDSSKVTVKMGVFTVGFNDRLIIDFGPGAGLEETTVDLNKSQEADMTLTYAKAGDRADIYVSTLPLHVSLDVQKLDDTFASYGGFSGVLKIGNHIKSTCILPPKVAPAPKAPAPAASSSASMPKVNARLGGLTFKLEGESCGLLVETSAIKVAVREKIVGTSIRHLRLSGPHSTTSAVMNDSPPLSAEINDIRLEYAFTPAETDLSNLLSLITPTDFKYEADDDILIDTLLSQRRKGSVIRVRVQKSVQLSISDLEGLKQLQSLSKDVAKLSSVAKLLPDDERPGILSMIDAAQCDINVVVNERAGALSLACSNLRVAHVGLPSLLAIEVGAIDAQRDGSEILLDQVHTTEGREAVIPMFMARMLGDEMEPTLKVKLFNLLIDYRVTTIMAVLGLSEHSTAEDVALGMASSVATIKRAPSPGSITRYSSGISERSGSASRPLNLDLLLRDCAIGLNPRKSAAKSLVVLSDTRFTGSLMQDVVMTAMLDIRKASLLVIDDVSRLAQDEAPNVKPSSAELGSQQVVNLCRLGFVSVGTTSKAKAIVKIREPDGTGPRTVDVEFNNDLFVMESCADSTQTLMAIFGGLVPPQPPSKAVQYRTKVEPVVNMMASLAGDELKMTREDKNLDMSIIVDDDDHDLHFMGSFYDPSQLPSLEEMTEESIQESMIRSSQALGTSDPSSTKDVELNFEEDFFGKPSGDKPIAQGWNSRKNEYIESSEVADVKSPLTLRVRDVHFIWNLYDGYDWPRTREKLGQKLEEVQQRAQERRDRRHDSDEDDGLTIEEDLLFGSVYIALPLNQTPEENRRQINHAMRGGDDTASETSYATTTASRSTTRPKSRGIRLKLERGRHHKVTFELKGICADVVVFPPGDSETQNSVVVRVKDLDVIDHVPTSTWRKFVTYDRDAGERPLGSPIIQLEMLTVRPVPDLAASELVIRVSVLPLRLHVDQDALDFIVRFFEFKDDRASSAPAPGEQPFIQRLEVRTVRLKLDYKPKKVDYAGLRSGHTTEFMNFVILEGANIMLRRCIIYGISGFDKVHKTLNDIWMPDVKRNQIPSIIAGLAAMRGIANVGSGFRDLVTVPMREYKKDGRIIRSAQKGAMAFAKTTTTELLRLGAKVSIGTQGLIQGAEGLLSPASPSAGPSRTQSDTAWEDVSPGTSPDGPKAFSNYADQPIGVRAGLISARRHLQHDFASARDAIIAIPGEVMDSGTATGAAKAVVRHAPVVILRPFTGVAKATGATLFGAANALDKDSRRKIDDKYKRR